MADLTTKRLVAVLVALLVACAVVFCAVIATLTWQISRSLEDRAVHVISGSEFSREMPPLHQAAWNRQHGELKRLLASGSDPNESHDGVIAETPLHLAAVGNRGREARRLLRSGADVNAQGAYLHLSPLHLASVAGHPRMANLLKRHGADENLTDFYGSTPARAAALWEDAASRQLESIEVGQGMIDPRCLVRVYWIGQRSGQINHQGSVLGFVVHPGARVVTAEHCLGPMHTMERAGHLVRPLVLSAFYGDVFEASVEHVDAAADAAVLKVSWPGHPAFGLAAPSEVAEASELMIAGHPPDVPAEDRGVFARWARAETLPVLRYDPDAGKRGLIMGPRRYVGPGWSGAPILLPGTGKVAGVFGTREVWRYGPVTVISNLEGCSVDAFRGVVNNAAPVPEVQAPADAEAAYEVLVTLLDAATILDSDRFPVARDAALAIRPESAMVQLLSIALRRTLGAEEQQAVDHGFERVFQLAGDSALAQGLRGLHAIEQDRRDEAGPYFDRALELAPDLVFCRLWKARLMRTDDPVAAEQVIREAVEENASLFFELSRNLSEQRRFEEALDALRKACAAFGDDEEIPHIWVRHMADSLKGLGLHEESESWYRRLFETHECPKCWLAYAGLLRDLGSERHDDVLEAIDRARGCGETLSEENTRFIEQLQQDINDGVKEDRDDGGD